MLSRFSIFIVVALLISAGCTYAPRTFDRAASERAPQGGIPVHGIFCGPGTPPAAMEAFDDIDRVCKKHDLCYLEKGYFNQQCDNKLIKSFGGLMEFDNKRCEFLQATIYTYFVWTSGRRSRETATPFDALLMVISAPKKIALTFNYLVLDVMMNPIGLPEKFEICNATRYNRCATSIRHVGSCGR